MLTDLKRLADEAVKTPPLTCGELYPPSLYYSFFRLYAKEYKPRLSVVLGVCGGGDCYHLAVGNPEGIVVGVDNKWDHPPQLKHMVDNCPNFRFMLSDSLYCSSAIHGLYGKIDFLFLDTVHTYEQTLAEYIFYKSCLSDGALVVLDDLFRPGMDRAWEWMPEPKIKLDFLHCGRKVSETVGDGGLGVVLC